MRSQSGQSMVEFAVGAAVMALLLLGSITIAGYQGVQRQMTIAARQATFQASWSTTRGNQEAVTRRAAESRLDHPSLINAFGNRYAQASDLSIAASSGSAPGRAAAAGRVMVEPLRAAGGFLGGGFDLSVNGLLTGTIKVSAQPDRRLPDPFGAMSVELTQPFALMTDAWNASGPSHVRSRTGGLVPTSVLSNLKALWMPLLAPLSLIEPSISRLCLGMIEADRVPEDRLGSGRTALPGRCP